MFLKGGIRAFVIAVISNIICTLCVTVVPLIISFTIDSVLGDEPVTGIFAEAVKLFGGIENVRANIWIPAAVIAAIALLNALVSYANT